MLTPAPNLANERPREPAWHEFARAPLVPIAVAATLGLIVDRYFAVTVPGALAVGIGGLVAWCYGRNRPSAIFWLAVAAAGLAAAHHNLHRNSYGSDNIGLFAPELPAPVRIRGELVTEPSRRPAPPPNPLVTQQPTETTAAVLAVTALESQTGWQPVSGRVRLTVEGRLQEFHYGDRVEVIGRLQKPGGPLNPGELDFRSWLLDQRITALLHVEKSSATVVRLEEGWRNSLFGWLGLLRNYGARKLDESLSPNVSAVAAALLLGDTSALDQAEWDAYLRTGVVYVLAISGQHLGVLAAFIWFTLNLFGVRRRRSAWIVALVLIGYALLTGARPSAVRAAVMVSVICLAIIARRPVIPANALALAWLIVVIVNPTDPFSIGCQLSFFSVFMLIWGAGRWFAPQPLSPTEQLVRESRTTLENGLHAVFRSMVTAFGISLLLMIANAPVILWWQHLISPVGVLIGPPMILLTSIALIAGFLVLLLSPVTTTLAWPFARITEWALLGSNYVVNTADQIPGAYTYSPAPPMWWILGFYFLLAGAVLVSVSWTRRVQIGVVVWVLLGLLATAIPREKDGCVFTFLAVGHGGCVVIETPDNRVILYDAGTTTGPEAVRRIIAPFLWHKGITRIDEVFLSHADLDHFNGVPELLRRFTIGQVTVTPSFAVKTTPGVEVTLATITKRKIPIRVAAVGDRYVAGELTFEVLHPPRVGPAGNENVRSMVLLARFRAAKVLLTGDIEGIGQEMLREREIEEVEVMLAPHHGAKAANVGSKSTTKEEKTSAMADWAKPKFVISSQRLGNIDHLRTAYEPVSAEVWDTSTSGAIIVYCNNNAVTALGYRSQQMLVVKRRRDEK